jgi:hypothetical protein
MTSHPIQHIERNGPDRRMRTKTNTQLGRHAFRLPSRPFGVPTFDPGSGFPQYFVVDPADMPYSTDDADEPFTGAAFVCVLPGSGSTGLPLTTPLTFYPGCPYPKRTQAYWWALQGIPLGATGTISFSTLIGGALLAELVISGSDGPVQVKRIPSFAGFADPDDDVLEVIVEWTGGLPAEQWLVEDPIAFGMFLAVPATLPAGYTAHNGERNRQQSFGERDHFRGGRLRAADNYATPRNRGLIIEQPLHAWIDGTLYQSEWIPSAFDQVVDTLSQGFFPDIEIVLPFPPGGTIIVPVPAPTDVAITGVGWRASNLTIATTNGASTGGVSFHYTVTRSDTGATIYDATLTDAELAAGVDVDLGPIIAATNVPLTVTVHVDDPGDWFTPVSGDHIQLTLTLSPRCDIPLHHTTVGRNNLVVQGGYDATTLEAPTNDFPLVTLGAGVTSHTPAVAAQPIAYVIGSDGWYKVVRNGVDRSPVGENEFGLEEGDAGRTVDRGHAGRLFYMLAGDAVFAHVLTAYTPSFTAIASGGTTLTTNLGGVWAYGSISFPAAGTYDVAIVALDEAQVIRGLVFEWSASDSTCVDTDGKITWEPWFLAPQEFGGMLSAPPGSPTDDESYIVGEDATGDWEGHDGDIATYSETLSLWYFLPPELGAVVAGGIGSPTWMWYDGTAWREPSDAIIRKRFTVDGPTTLACTFSALSTENDPLTPPSPQISVAWAAV